mmetsp:Transcript_8020/g.12655  ORF Transcript_8020/g.12655 Transcript_8020/m.12655 type:complete len:202 (+) Transcript_8020:557-1162(+)
MPGCCFRSTGLILASSASKTTRDCACAVATESSSSSPARRVPSRLTRKQFSEPIVISSAATCTCATLLAEFANAVCSCFVSSFFTAALSWLHAWPRVSASFVFQVVTCCSGCPKVAPSTVFLFDGKLAVLWLARAEASSVSVEPARREERRVRSLRATVRRPPLHSSSSVMSMKTNSFCDTTKIWRPPTCVGVHSYPGLIQ